MNDEKFREFDFDNPSKLQVAIENLVFGLFGRLAYRPILDFIEIKGDEKILDFGCGGGFLTKRLYGELDEKGRIIGLDSSNYYIDKAKNRSEGYSNIEFVSGKIEDLEDGYFDIIIINFVIHDIRPSRREEVFSGLSGKIGLGKKLYINEPTKPNHGIGVKQLRRYLGSSGFKEERFILNKSRYTGCWQKI